MSLSDFPFDEDAELIKEINHLREIGLIEVVGIDNDGEWLYGPTEEGKNLAEALRNLFLMDQDDE